MGAFAACGGAPYWQYGATIVYEYVVAATTHTSDKVTFGDFSSSDSSHARGILERYPKGSRVTVYYDPADPGTAVLEPGATGTNYILLAGGSALLLAPVAVTLGRRFGPFR